MGIKITVYPTVLTSTCIIRRYTNKNKKKSFKLYKKKVYHVAQFNVKLVVNEGLNTLSKIFKAFLIEINLYQSYTI